jgi:hypothetical protein
MRPYEGFVQAYMHNGFFKDLLDVVHFYNTRDVEEWPPPEVEENVNTDELGNLGLTADEEVAVVAFMMTLTDGWTPEMEQPAVPAVANVTPRLILNGSFPNPFQGSTEIRFSVGERTPVNLAIFDVTGRRVRSLISGRTEMAGPQKVAWDARDDAGRMVAPGVYFYSLQAGKVNKTQRIVLLP